MKRQPLNNTYYIGNYKSYKVIYCEETKSYILDTEGDPVSSEEYSLYQMFGIDDELEILKEIDLTLSTEKAINDLMNYSSGFRMWIEAKEI